MHAGEIDTVLDQSVKATADVDLWHIASFAALQRLRVAHFLRTARHPAEEDETFETLDLRVRQDMWGIGQVRPPA
jgi:hypothetical protein